MSMRNSCSYFAISDACGESAAEGRICSHVAVNSSFATLEVAASRIGVAEVVLDLVRHLLEENRLREVLPDGVFSSRLIFFKGRVRRAFENTVAQTADKQLRNCQVSVEATARAGRSEPWQLVAVSSA